AVTRSALIREVDVGKVRSGKESRSFEIAKYAAKDSDYPQNQKVFEVLYKALKGKRLIVLSGLFKEAMTKFKNGELDGYKEKDLTKYVYASMYNWGGRKYLEMEKRYLTDDELEEVNGKVIDEKDVD